MHIQINKKCALFKTTARQNNINDCKNSYVISKKNVYKKILQKQQ